MLDARASTVVLAFHLKTIAATMQLTTYSMKMPPWMGPATGTPPS